MQATYDIEKLQKCFNEFLPGVRIKAFKAAFRASAKEVRKMAISNMKSAKGGKKGSLNASSRMEKGVRAEVFKKTPGFHVTIRPKKTATKKQQAVKSEYWLRRYQGIRDAGILDVWLEGGTVRRKTKSKTKVWTRSRKGHDTGSLDAYEFMKKTKSEAEVTAASNLRENILQSVSKIIDKYAD